MNWLKMLVSLALFAILSGPAWAQVSVKVGGYEFPPYVESGKDDMVGSLISALNDSQAEYRFEFVPISARRRYADLSEGRFDVMFFESPLWGWQKQADAAAFTKVFMTGAEVYVTLSQPGRDQGYFDDFAGKTLVGILGYHYGFADFEGDPKQLEKKFDIKLVSSHRSSIELVLAGRRDVAVVTEAYLRRYLKNNPQAASRLLVSNRQDQVYEHRVLVRRSGPVTVETMQKLLDDLQKRGVFSTLKE
ncbi:MAG: transporter substrate-binding domain-containing protein [Magnetospirillum sp.]|nr:transporter substrate-binding domain-containing protein [Magnetospirillum sp.]